MSRVNAQLALKAYRDKLVKDTEFKVKIKAHSLLADQIFNPLTAIQNYFSLVEEVKKEEIKNPKILDFIEKGNQSILILLKKLMKLKILKIWKK